MAEAGGSETPHAPAPAAVADTVPDASSASAYGPAGARREAVASSADFERVALPCLSDVARFARSLTHDEPEADDLVQETYLRAFDAWHTFVPGSDCRPWLFTICRRLFVRARHRDRRVVAVGDDAEAETFAAVRLHNHARAVGVDDLFTRLDVGPAIVGALAELPEVFRSVVQLVDVEGLGYEEAAAILDVPVGTVRSRLFRARRMLQEQLVVYAEDLGLARGRSAAPRAATVPLPPPPADR
jgi:RNA polymerase sigma-70 factor (ECF subfamily)